MKDMKKDEWAIVLDFLSQGHYKMKISQPLAQVMGDKFFTLLEVIIREGVQVRVGQKVYIGEGKREEIRFINRKISFNDLTTAAKDEVHERIEKIVSENPERFLDFFNSSGPITTRMHKLELLPGIGKKHLWAIIRERKEKDFTSFADIKKRLPVLPDPEKLIVRRIIDELKDSDKYRIFVPRFEKGRR